MSTIEQIMKLHQERLTIWNTRNYDRGFKDWQLSVVNEKLQALWEQRRREKSGASGQPDPHNRSHYSAQKA